MTGKAATIVRLDGSTKVVTSQSGVPQPHLSVFPAPYAAFNFFLERVMGRKLYVGNLPYSIGDSDLERMFEEFGTVQSVQIIMDRDTGRSKGFGFVEMGSDQEAQAAIDPLNGKNVDGRNLPVNEAKPREERGGGGRGGFGGGRSGGGGYGGGRGGGGYGGGRRDRY